MSRAQRITHTDKAQRGGRKEQLLGFVVTVEVFATMMNFHNFIMRNADGYSVELRCYSVAFFSKISADKVTKINRSDKVSALGSVGEG